MGSVAVEKLSVTVDPTDVVVSGEVEGEAVVSFPLMAPKDNVEEVVDVRVRRVRRPVRIRTATIELVHEGGVLVKVPHAGENTVFGPRGVTRVFTGVPEALEWMGTVLGQVTHVYTEQPIEDGDNDPYEEILE